MLIFGLRTRGFTEPGRNWISDFLQRGINIYKDLTSDRLLKLYRFEGNLDPNAEETTGAKNAKGSDIAQSSQKITKNTNNKETVIIIVPPEDKKPEEMVKMCFVFSNSRKLSIF